MITEKDAYLLGVAVGIGYSTLVLACFVGPELIEVLAEPLIEKAKAWSIDLWLKVGDFLIG